MFPRAIAKQKVCEIGRPCGSSCVPKNHRCKNEVEGTAKTLVQWMADKSQNTTQRQSLRSPSENKNPTTEDSKESLPSQNKVVARSFSSHSNNTRKISVLAGKNSDGSPIKNEIAADMDQITLSERMTDIQGISKAIDKYVEIASPNQSASTLYKKIQEFEIGEISYTVNGSPERISVESSGDRSYTRKDLDRIGIKTFRMLKSYIEEVPDGTILHCLASSRDGAGDYRERIYNKIGFGKPLKEFDEYQFAIKKEGKLFPLNQSQLIIEIIKSPEKPRSNKPLPFNKSLALDRLSSRLQQR